MSSHSFDSTGKQRPRWGLLIVLVAASAAALVTAALILFSDEEADVELAGGPERSITDLEAESPVTGDLPDETVRVERTGEEGERNTLDGRLFLNGSPLAGVTVQAVADPPDDRAAGVVRRLRTSPLYYSARIAKTDVIEKIDTLSRADRRPPAPSAECKSGEDGSYSLSLWSAESVAFQLGHDFYFLPRDDAGPHEWKSGTGSRELDGYDGTLAAELGAMIRGTVSDGEGLPVEGVTVRLAERQSDERGGPGFFGRWGGQGFTERETVTDKRGDFAFRGVEPGQVLGLETAAKGYAAVESDDIEPVPGQVHRADLSLHPGAAIRVLVRGPEGVPLQGADVYLEKQPGTAEGERGGRGGGRGPGMFMMGGGVTVAGSGTTGAAGEVLFESLEPGEYGVKAYFPGMLGKETSDPLALTADSGTLSVDLALNSGNAISGIVVDDLQRPVSGALVKALPHTQRGGPGGRPDFEARMEIVTAPPGALKEAYTAADGSFHITGLSEEKSYDLFAEAEELVPARSRDIEPGTAGEVLVMDRSAQIKGRVVSAATGEAVTRFTVRTVPAPEDEDRRDRGRGFDRFRRDGRGGGGGESSDPMRSVFMEVGQLMWQGGGDPGSLTDKEEDFVDSGGSFALKDIVPGRYRLCVSGGGLAPQFTEPFEVAIGEVLEGLTVALDPGASVSGKAVSGYGPVADASVRIRIERGEERDRDRDRDRDLDLLMDTVDPCETDDEGRFEIAGLPPGLFSLRGSHRDHPPVTGDAIALSEGQSVDGVVLQFPPGARIFGIAYDEMGAPLEEQMLTCRPSEGRGDFKRERTDREGKFEFSELRAGTYRVSIQSGGMGFRGRGGGDDSSVEVDLAEDGVAEIVVQKKPPEGVTVQGVITDDAGPIGRGFLTVSPAAGRGGRDAMRTGTINEDGTFKVEGVAPGSNRFSLRFMTSETFESTTLEFDIPDQLVFHLDILLPAGRIAGVVLDEATRMPLADVRVSLSAEGEETGGGGGQRGRGRFGNRGRSVVTDASGVFQFRLLTAGTYGLEARPPGDLTTGDGEPYFNAEVSDLVLGEGRVMEGIEMVVGPGGSIAVTIVDENSEPVDGAQVTATPDGQNGSASRRGRSGDDGLAVVDGVKPGIYTLNIQARWMAQEAVEGIAVASGRTVNTSVTLQSGMQVSLRLTDSEGSPVTGAEITLRNSRGSHLTVRGARGGRGNSYSLGTLAPGRYTIEAEWDDNQGSAEIDISAAGTIPVQLK